MRYSARPLCCLILTLFAVACDAAATPNAVSPERNVALASEGATAVADSEYGGHSAGQAIDGQWIGTGDPPQANRWHAALDHKHPHWVWIRFRQPARISRMVLHRADIVDYPVDFVGEWSADGGATFKTLFTVTHNQMTPQDFEVARSFAPVVTDNFRLRMDRSSYLEQPDYAQLSEIEVMGQFQGQHAPADKPIAPAKLPMPLLSPTQSQGLKITADADQVEFRSPWLRLVLSLRKPQMLALCWDSLGVGKVDENLLKPGSLGGASFGSINTRPASQVSTEISRQGNVVRYAMRLDCGVQRRFEIRVAAKSVEMAISTAAAQAVSVLDQPVIQFAFAVDKTPVSPLADPQPGVPAPLPCLLHAADYGSLLVRSSDKSLFLEGEPLRGQARWNAAITQVEKSRNGQLRALRAGTSQSKLTFSVEKVVPVPALIQDEPKLQALPRYCLNTFQYRPEIGILSNNVVSDNAVFCMFTYTDPAVFTPVLPGGVEAIQLARESVDRYLAGAGGYGSDSDTLMDTDPALLISAWDVIRVTGDQELLHKWLPHVRRLARHIETQDHDGNGLPESTRTGLPGQHKVPSSNWWDQINFGYEDAYCCALDYRTFQCAADLERLSGNTEEAARCDQAAERIRKAYLPNFFNPETGVIAGWKDRDGKLHDYWFVFVNGIAITYGLVPRDKANAIVDRIEAKLKEVGYTRFDLGLPGNLVPVPKLDYGGGPAGPPQKPDGSDAFGLFENGGATACYAYFYIQALYQLGRLADAERILWPMMKTYAEGGFQNGVGKAGEWRRWDGTPSGYEGMLADAYYSQMAVFTGHYGIAFGPSGFRLEPWSPLKGKKVPLGLKYMGKVVKELQ